MKISEEIKLLEKQIKNPRHGLPEEIFLFVSRLTPIVNVDLLIKDEKGKTLLSWRDDKFCGSGWHIPGGILRFKENFKTRIQKVIDTEIGLPVKFDPKPIAINQITGRQNTRGHFISILFKCFLSGKYVLKNKGLQEKDKGFLKWHESCPVNLINILKIYKKFI